MFEWITLNEARRVSRDVLKNVLSSRRRKKQKSRWDAGATIEDPEAVKFRR
ncbi:MAG: hypothetical protein ACRD4S_14740 [Candidatus Acidiferrales bacterium]